MITATGRSSQRLEESKCHSCLQKGPASRPVSLTSIPGMVVEQLIWETILSYVKYQKIIRRSQHVYTKGKSCFTSLLIPFYNEMTGLVGEERAVDIAYLAFSNTYDTVPHKTLIDKLMKCRLDEQTEMRIENCLSSWSQRVVLRGTKSTWSPVTSGVPRALAQIAQRGCGVTVLGVIPKHLYKVLGSGSRCPCLNRGVEQDDCQMFFPISPIL